MVQAHRIKAIALVGCTAVGKSETSIKIAKRFNGAIISADSMQIYRRFDIGTGKLPVEDRGGIYHSMIDIVDGDAEFSVGEYVKSASREISHLDGIGKLPIIVGGTGLYVSSLFAGCNFAQSPKDDRVRNALKSSAHFLGGSTLHSMLAVIDRLSAEKISPNDIKRVIRAIEIFCISGTVKSAAISHEKPYDDLSIVLTLPRDILYKKINDRVHAMFEAGLVAEVEELKCYKGCQAMQALGYKQISENPDMSVDELESLVAQKTRNYAKRQMTYFNNMKLNKVFIDARDYDKIEACVANFIGE